MHQNIFNADNHESERDDSSVCGMEKSFFCTGSDEVFLPPEETEEDSLDEKWMWNKLEEIGDNDAILGPIEKKNTHNGPHGLKDGISNNFF